MVLHSLNSLAREAAVPKICALLESIPWRVTRGNRVRPQTDSRGNKDMCKEFTDPKEEKDVLQKIKKNSKIIYYHLNSCTGNTSVFNEHVFQTCLNGNGLDLDGNVVLVAT